MAKEKAAPKRDKSFEESLWDSQIAEYQNQAAAAVTGQGD